MHKNFTYSDPRGSFTWIHPVSLQREYLVPPEDHEEAIELFRAHPDFGKLLRAYREASESRGGATNVRDAVKSGLKRVEDVADSMRRARDAKGGNEKGRSGEAPA